MVDGACGDCAGPGGLLWLPDPPCLQCFACLVPAVHQPDGGSADVHARDGLPRCGAGGPGVVRCVPCVVAVVAAAVASLLRAAARDRVPRDLLLLPWRLL